MRKTVKKRPTDDLPKPALIPVAELIKMRSELRNRIAALEHQLSYVNYELKRHAGTAKNVEGAKVGFIDKYGVVCIGTLTGEEMEMPGIGGTWTSWTVVVPNRFGDDKPVRCAVDPSSIFPVEDE